MDFIEKVKKLMKENDLTQKELASKAKITEASMSKYLSGERTPRIDVVVNLAKALKTTTDYLLGNNLVGSSTYNDAYEVIARSKDVLSEEDKKKLIKLLLEDWNEIN